MKKIIIMLAIAFLITNTNLNFSMEAPKVPKKKKVSIKKKISISERFLYALVDKNIDRVQRILKLGRIDINKPFNIKPYEEFLPLGIIPDDPKLIKLLLDAGANPNLRDRDGNTILHIVVYMINLEKRFIIRWLEDMQKTGTDNRSNIQRSKDNINDLIESLKLICSYPDIDLNIKNEDNETIWDLAKQYPLAEPDITKILEDCQARKASSSKG